MLGFVAALRVCWIWCCCCFRRRHTWEDVEVEGESERVGRRVLRTVGAGRRVLGLSIEARWGNGGAHWSQGPSAMEGGGS